MDRESQSNVSCKRTESESARNGSSQNCKQRDPEYGFMMKMILPHLLSSLSSITFRPPHQLLLNVGNVHSALPQSVAVLSSRPNGATATGKKARETEGKRSVVRKQSEV